MMGAQAGMMPLLAEDREPWPPGSWKAHRLSSFPEHPEGHSPANASKTQFQISDFLNYQTITMCYVKQWICDNLMQEQQKTISRACALSRGGLKIRKRT